MAINYDPVMETLSLDTKKYGDEKVATMLQTIRKEVCSNDKGCPAWAVGIEGQQTRTLFIDAAKTGLGCSKMMGYSWAQGSLHAQN